MMIVRIQIQSLAGGISKETLVAKGFSWRCLLASRGVLERRRRQSPAERKGKLVQVLRDGCWRLRVLGNLLDSWLQWCNEWRVPGTNHESDCAI